MWVSTVRVVGNRSYPHTSSSSRSRVITSPRWATGLPAHQPPSRGDPRDDDDQEHPEGAGEEHDLAADRQAGAAPEAW